MTPKTKRTHTYKRLLIGSVCALLIIGSSAILLALHTTSSSPGPQQANTTSTPHRTSTPTTPITPTSNNTDITPTPTPLFTDDFSSNSQGWYINDSEGYTRSLSQNGLTLTDINHNPMIESLPINHKFDDFTLTITLALKQGDINDSAGIYLRGDSNLDHDYRIDIFGNSTYAISKEYLGSNNVPQALYLIGPSHATPLKTRNSANTLTVIMKGATMILFINDKLVNFIIDEDYIRGQVALFVANGATSSGVSAVFSSIKIDSAPDQFPLIQSCTATPGSTTTPTPKPTPTSIVGITPSTCK